MPRIDTMDYDAFHADWTHDPIGSWDRWKRKLAHWNKQRQVVRDTTKTVADWQELNRQYAREHLGAK